MNLDWITFEQEFLPPTSSSPPSVLPLNETIYNVNDGISYLPSKDLWTTSAFIDDSAKSITTYTTQAANASLTFNFTLPIDAGVGAIGIFGSMGPLHGNYFVSLFSTIPNTSSIVKNLGFSAHYARNTVHEQMLFYQDDLTPGASYYLVVNKEPSEPNTSHFGLEYIKTWSAGAGSLVTIPP